MMRQQHRSNNDVLRAPAGMTIEECSALAVTRIQYEDGTPAVASYWLPTGEELARLNEGKPIALVVLGRTHPPLFLAVDGDASLP